MSKKLKTILGIIVGVIIGLAVGWLLLFPLNILIFPLNLFLMSDLPESWTNIQEVVMYVIGIVSVVLIILSGGLGGWLGWQWSKGDLGVRNPKAKKILQTLIPLAIVGLLLMGATRGITFIGRLISSPTVRLTPSTSHVTIITDKTEYQQGETVKITVRNDSSDEKRLHSPFYYTVERLDNDSWIEIRRVFCPCGALCNILPYAELRPNEVFEEEWDQKETWCTDKPLVEQKTKSQQVPLGRYRVRIKISEGNQLRDARIIYSDEFTIEEREFRVGGPCTYSHYFGECTVTQVEKTERSKRQAEIPKCGYEGYEALFVFKTNQEIEKEWARKAAAEHESLLTLSGCRCTYPGQKYLEKYHIEVGSKHECTLKVIESGTCTPIQFEFEQVKQDDCFECLWKD